MKDLVCLHVILMALRVCNYDVDLDALGARMKMGVKALAPLCRELGCAVKKSAGKKSDGGGVTRATLPLDGTKTLQDVLPEIKRRLKAAKKRTDAMARRRGGSGDRCAVITPTHNHESSDF